MLLFKTQELSTVNDRQQAFTIVELLVVIVVIGILAAITIVSYSGIREKANLATLQSDLKNASTKLETYKVSSSDESYPSDTDSAGVKASPGTTLSYTRSTAVNYCLQGTNNGVTYHINSTSKLVTSGACVTCTDLPGFIFVPGDSTYGTSDFCVMAYEAKADTNNDGQGDTSHTTGSNGWPAASYPISESIKLVSSPAGYPVVSISQTTAISAAENYTRTSSGGNCTGCHVITENQWMTIAKNVLSNPNNWSSGTVGAGYIYSGHNDRAPDNALVVSNTDDPYDGTGDFPGDTGVGLGGMAGDTQRRRLQLTNGEYIWDFAGNVWEWTDYYQTGGQPNFMPGLNWYQWTSITDIGSIPSTQDPRPSSTGLINSNNWTSTNGVGSIYGNSSSTAEVGFIRGGSWQYYSSVGVLTLDLGDSRYEENGIFGLRVSR